MVNIKHNNALSGEYYRKAKEFLPSDSGAIVNSQRAETLDPFKASHLKHFTVGANYLFSWQDRQPLGRNSDLSVIRNNGNIL